MTEESANEHNAHELYLYASNTGELYRSQTDSVLNNLARHVVRQEYDEVKAIKALYHVAGQAARMYGKEFSTGERDGLRIFSTADRWAAAQHLLEHYSEEINERAEALIGPNEVRVMAYDFSRDVYGNPTGHYEVFGRRVTSRRIQIGYDGWGAGGAYTAIKKAGYRPGGYKLVSKDGSRAGGFYLIYRRVVEAELAREAMSATA